MSTQETEMQQKGNSTIEIHNSNPHILSHLLGTFSAPAVYRLNVCSEQRMRVSMPVKLCQKTLQNHFSDRRHPKFELNSVATVKPDCSLAGKVDNWSKWQKSAKKKRVGVLFIASNQRHQCPPCPSCSRFCRIRNASHRPSRLLCIQIFVFRSEQADRSSSYSKFW